MGQYCPTPGHTSRLLLPINCHTLAQCEHHPCAQNIDLVGPVKPGQWSGKHPSYAAGCSRHACSLCCVKQDPTASSCLILARQPVGLTSLIDPCMQLLQLSITLNMAGRSATGLASSAAGLKGSNQASHLQPTSFGIASCQVVIGKDSQYLSHSKTYSLTRTALLGHLLSAAPQWMPTTYGCCSCSSRK